MNFNFTFRFNKKNHNEFEYRAEKLKNQITAAIRRKTDLEPGDIVTFAPLNTIKNNTALVEGGRYKISQMYKGHEYVNLEGYPRLHLHKVHLDLVSRKKEVSPGNFQIEHFRNGRLVDIESLINFNVEKLPNMCTVSERTRVKLRKGDLVRFSPFKKDGWSLTVGMLYKVHSVKEGRMDFVCVEGCEHILIAATHFHLYRREEEIAPSVFNVQYFKYEYLVKEELGNKPQPKFKPGDTVVALGDVYMGGVLFNKNGEEAIVKSVVDSPSGLIELQHMPRKVCLASLYKLKTHNNMEIKISKDRILAAAAKCGTAKATLQTLFPEVFEDEKRVDISNFPDIIAAADGNPLMQKAKEIQDCKGYKHKDKAVWLSPVFKWEIVAADPFHGGFILIPTKK